MPPRPYNNQTRLQRQAELRERIAAAAARLHAEKGALATSWTEIAQAAGVSVPTVYKHFPDLEHLIPACTAHAEAGAPPLEAERLLACPDLGSAVHALVEAADRLNAYFEPWMVWQEQHRIAALARRLDEQRQAFTGLCLAILERHLGPGAERAPAAAAWESLLNFSHWHSLVRHHQLPRPAARRLLERLLLAAAGPQPAASPSPGPTPRKPS